MSDFAEEITALVKARVQQRHATGRYAIAGHPAETRRLASGKRAVPLHRAIEQQQREEEGQDD